jgi:hypothetical protein
VNVLARLEQWKAGGAISRPQYEVLSALARKDQFSLFVELNTLLYLGALAVVAGIGLTITTYSARLGDAAILSFLTGAFCWCLYFCAARALPYSHGEVEHPGLAFDYVLYLGCLVFGLDLGYLQSHRDCRRRSAVARERAGRCAERVHAGAAAGQGPQAAVAGRHRIIPDRSTTRVRP